MNLADVMDSLAARIEAVDGLRVYSYPADSVSPPAAVVSYPDAYDFDGTYSRGMDTMTVPVIVMVGRASERSARDQLAAYVNGSGPQSLKQAIETPSRVLPELSKFTKQTMSTDGAAASQLELITGPYLQVTLTAGTAAPTNLRDVFIHDDLTATDFHASATFDPPFFGTQFDPDLIPQHGIILRYQNDGSTQRAVAVWQNIFLGIPKLLVGVWQSTAAGGSFTNRQLDVGPQPLGLNLPYHVEARLRGSVVNVRQWEVGDPAPAWDDPVLAAEVDLETDAGNPATIPTPVGEGKAGFAANHLGFNTDPLCAVRYPLNSLLFEADEAFDTARVVSAEFGIQTIAGVDYVGAILNVEIAGTGTGI